MSNNNAIRISEIFGPTIQGEGALIGIPTVFVRTGGCDYRCSWCDTLFAVESKYRHDWQPMNAKEIMKKIKILSHNKPIMVTLSGGNPAIQPLGDLIKIGHEENYQFAMETQGSVVQDWFKDLDILTLSPKPPSSGEKTDWDKLTECIKSAGKQTRTFMKVVVFDEVDYTYAQDVQHRYPHIKLYLQPGNHQTEGLAEKDILNERLQWLAEKVANDHWYNVCVLPQLHVMIWGNARGV